MARRQIAPVITFLGVAVVTLAVATCSLDSVIGDTLEMLELPTPVSDLGAVIGDGEVMLLWRDPSNVDFDRIEITWEPDGATVQSIPPGTERLSVGGLTNGTAYTFTVVTVTPDEERSIPVTYTATPTAGS